MYLDSAYIAKFYVNEPDSPAVRELMFTAQTLISSAWAIAEVACVFHRHWCEGSLEEQHVSDLLDAFIDHVEAGFWNLLPVSDAILRRSALWIKGTPHSVYLRPGDAIHLATAQDAGEREIWTSDRHMLAAAKHLGIRGRTVQATQQRPR
ncbi:MAG TPA: type II toxin-antitoxin system VapC family toxin [Bryobacteraceae bacterium]|nr:type II toxin-antitoxin system VapC family toxin [Bryobacteraceae bacterium]